MLAAIGFTEFLLILLALGLTGGIPAAIARSRKRSPLAWFFIGLACAAVVGAIGAEVSIGPVVQTVLATALAPCILLLLPPGGARRKPDSAESS